jgi:hypothetical protein
LIEPVKDADFPLALILETEEPRDRIFAQLPGQSLRKVYSLDNLFESDIYDPGFEDGATGWYGGGSALIRTVKEPVAEGEYAAEVYNRGKAWHGISQLITGFLMQNLQGRYEISAEVMPKNVADEFTIGIQFFERGERFRFLGQPVHAEPGEWTTVSTVIALDWNDWIERASLQIRRTHVDDAFYIDDVRIEQIERGRGL